jgi:hypothetical protein
MEQAAAYNSGNSTGGWVFPDNLGSRSAAGRDCPDCSGIRSAADRDCPDCLEIRFVPEKAVQDAEPAERYCRPELQTVQPQGVMLHI